MQKLRKCDSASFMPMLSSPLIPFSFTSGSEQNIYANLIGFVIWDSYLVLTFSPSPVSDLINSKFRALCMHLDWFYNHIFYFSSPEIYFIILVFNTISFSRVLAEVRHALILAVLMNYYIFFFLSSSFELISLYDIFSLCLITLDIALR